MVRRALAGLVTLLVCAASLALFGSGRVDPLRDALRPPLVYPEDLVVVEIDHDAEAAHGLWRWPRDLLARVFDATHEYGARTVATTLFMAGEGPDPAADSELIEASKDVVVPIRWDGTRYWQSLTAQGQPAGVDVELLVKRDRQYTPHVGEYPSIALAALAAHRGWSEERVEATRRPMTIFADTHVVRVSAAQLLDPSQAEANERLLRDKLVLVARLDAAEVHAQAIAMLDASRSTRGTPLMGFMGFVAIVLIIAPLAIRVRALIVILGAAGFAALWVVAATALSAGVTEVVLPVAPVLVTLATLAPLFALNSVWSAWRAPRAADAHEAPRGTVAIVFTDVQCSTDLWEHDRAAMAEALRLHDEVLRRWVNALHLYEVKTEGDAFMVAAPDVASALTWCIRVQEDLLRVLWPDTLLAHPEAATFAPDHEVMFQGLRVRMGVHFGAVESQPDPGIGRMDYFGPTVNRAARVADLAAGGQIVVTREAWEQKGPLAALVTTRWLGAVELKGISGAQEVVEVLPLSLASRRFDAVDTLDGLGSLARRYELADVLGEGGMATVYRAWDRALETHVAVKVLHSAEDLERIKSEVRMARRVTHRSVLRFHDFGTDEDVAFITMELAEGGTLADGAHDWTVAVDIARGLAAIHEAGIVHRDVKPANVLFGADGRPKVGDFGISLDTTGDRAEVVGTPAYMSPEQIRGQPPTPASDVYSFGVLLYELLAGELPFTGSAPKLITSHLAQPVPPLPEHISSGLAGVVMRALEKDPGKRFADGGALLAALLEENVGEPGQRDIAVEPPPPAFPPR